MTRETIGDRLRGFRRMQGWTQAEVVALCSTEIGTPLFSERELRRWERDEATPRPGPALRALARVYHVRVGVLLEGEPFDE